ncbi:MAG: hypothetical protein U0223_04645 [Nitrospira sp.]|nr:hypothetical protein [Nitrospira sp.]
MVDELRTGLFLFVSFAFLMLIIAVITLGSVMKPNRWNERTRIASKVRVSGSKRLSVTI